MLLLISLISEVSSPSYPIPDTTIYDSISPPYILYIKDAPGICHYWFFDSDGTAQPLLDHQIKTKQFSGLTIYERQYNLYRK